MKLTGPSATSASSTMVGPPEDKGPPTAEILMRIENLASIAYKTPRQTNKQQKTKNMHY